MINLRDFRIGWRLLISEPVYAAVVVAGLSLGFAACFLLLAYVHYSLNYDAQVPDKERVFVAKERINTFFAAPLVNDSMPLPFSDVASKSGLTSAVGIVHGMFAVMQAEGHPANIQISAVNPGFVQIFGLRTIDGDLDATLNQPDAIALTLSTAVKLFGNTNVLKKNVRIDGNLFQVTALLADPPSNTNEPFFALVGMQSLAWPIDERNSYATSWGDGVGKLYLKLRPGASARALEVALQTASDQFGFGDPISPELRLKLGKKKPRDVQLVALSDRYFDPELADGGTVGSKPVVFGLVAVSVMVLFLAVSNYVNLNLVRTVRRQREIAVRKLMGASASHLVGLFLIESLIVIMIATILGLLLTWLSLPLFSEMMLRNLDNEFTTSSLVFAMLLGCGVALLSGIYPAWIALRINPAQSISGRGNNETSGGLRLRRALTLLQFSVAIGFTGLTMVIALQINFTSHVASGFDPSNLAIVNLPTYQLDESSKALRDEIARLPDVLGVASSSNAPGANNYKIGHEMTDRQGHIVSLAAQQVSPNYFDVYKVDAMAGRLFDTHLDAPDNIHRVILNRLGAQILGYADPRDAVGQTVAYMGNEWQVIGIAPDIRHQSLREHFQPLAYQLSARTPVLTIRFNGQQSSLENRLAPLWERVYPAYPFQLRSARAALADSYADDVRLAKLLLASSTLAIAIAAFGMYVLSSYTVQRRQREIVLRKLYGATGNAIARLLAVEFGGLIAVSAVLGLPVAYLVGANYLAQFVERAPIGQWPLLCALLSAALIAFFAVLRHVLVALRISPIAALRT